MSKFPISHAMLFGFSDKTIKRRFEDIMPKLPDPGMQDIREENAKIAFTREVESQRLLHIKFGATAYTRKSDDEIVGVGWPINGNKFFLFGVGAFNSQLEATEYLEKMERERNAPAATK